MIERQEVDIGTEIMAYEAPKTKLDSELIILGLGYGTGLIVVIGWVASLVH